MSCLPDVKAWLPNLIDEVIEKQSSEQFNAPSGIYSTEKQKALGLEVMKLLQFDFEHGRLGKKLFHPFIACLQTVKVSQPATTKLNSFKA